jgi:hypothetical protein
MGSYAGIDWASEKHDVLIAHEEDGQRLLAETFAHDEQGITGCATRWPALRLTSSQSSAATGC